MTKPTITQSDRFWGLFRDNLTHYTKEECIFGKTYGLYAEAEVARKELLSELPVGLHKLIKIVEIK